MAPTETAVPSATPTETQEVLAAVATAPPEVSAVRALPSAGEERGDLGNVALILALAGLVAVATGQLLKRWVH